jgi:glycosyltransferase involved in cell wall biosynthesis
MPANSSLDENIEVLNECTPLLSILCITYNHEMYIAQAIDSFLMQKTDFQFEIVIGEDCSRDGTLPILESYKRLHPSLIKIITSEYNVGFVENFRRTLGKCKGKYIAICEGDDYWVDEFKLQIQVNFLENNSDYVITYHDAYQFSESARSTTPQLLNEFQRDATQDELLLGRPISTLTVCFRNVILEIPPEFNSTPILDLCLWSLLAKFGKGKYLQNIKPAAYRAHEGGVFSAQTSRNKIRMSMHTFLCLSRYYERVGDRRTSENFTFQTLLMASSQISSRQKFRLIAIQMDSLLGSPFYSLLKMVNKFNIFNKLARRTKSK